MTKFAAKTLMITALLIVALFIFSDPRAAEQACKEQRVMSFNACLVELTR